MESKAQRYRQRAKDLRAIAKQLTDAKARSTLLDVAQDYERMADSDDSRPTAKSDGKDSKRAD